MSSDVGANEIIQSSKTKYLLSHSETKKNEDQQSPAFQSSSPIEPMGNDSQILTELKKVVLWNFSLKYLPTTRLMLVLEFEKMWQKMNSNYSWV